jgi:hypothetical protein
LDLFGNGAPSAGVSNFQGLLFHVAANRKDIESVEAQHFSLFLL